MSLNRVDFEPDYSIVLAIQENKKIAESMSKLCDPSYMIP